MGDPGFLSDENLQAANAALVDYLRQLELAAHWGTGTFSSSDGQRSPARGRAATADPATREFGYRRGAQTVLNWTSDQYSQYGTKVVSVAERETVHTLEAILHTSLEIREHTTDTHGATEHVFALFDLLGLRFIPRLRDAGELRLHRLGPPTGLPVDAVMRARARPNRIREHCDELLRAAASLNRGWVPASLLLTRLNSSPQTPLAAALGEYGRIVRTNFLLRYCADPELRSRITGQLNKGETLHALRRQPRDQFPRPTARRRERPPPPRPVPATARQRRAGLEHPLHHRRPRSRRRHAPDLVADDTALARLAPVGHAHINRLGRYRFDDPHAAPAGQLQPLHRPDTDQHHSRPSSPIGVSGDKHQALGSRR